jgi:cyanophycinase
MRGRGVVLGALIVGTLPPLFCAQNNGVTGNQSTSNKLYQYSRYGDKDDISTPTLPGVALLGGGLGGASEALQWLCNKSGGGDFLILNAENSGDLLVHMVASECNEHSVAVLTVPSREAARDPFVSEVIGQAEAIFIDGGIQENYVKFWMGTPMQQAINVQISRSVPIAGTSAGMAMLGEFAYVGSCAQ